MGSGHTKSRFEGRHEHDNKYATKSKAAGIMKEFEGRAAREAAAEKRRQERAAERLKQLERQSRIGGGGRYSNPSWFAPYMDNPDEVAYRSLHAPGLDSFYNPLRNLPSFLFPY